MKWVKEGMAVYDKRIRNYFPFEVTEIPALRNTRNLSENEQRDKEAALILKTLKPGEKLLLLDETGKQMSSVAFSRYIDRHFSSGIKRMTFVVGGPYGFSRQLHDEAIDRLSLSPMTFSHQIVRVLFLEQLYRALTILRNEPYHHA